MRTNIANAILGTSSPSSFDTFIDHLRIWRRRAGYYSIFAALPAVLTAQAQDASAREITTPKTPQHGPNSPVARTAMRWKNDPAFLRRQGDYRLPHQKRTFDLARAAAGNDDCPGRAIPGGIYTAAAPYLDSGDTTGANSTISSLYGYYYTYGAGGPDHVYSFTLAGRGANPQIKVTTSSGTFRPMVYLLNGEYRPCVSGTGNFEYPWALNDSRWTAGNNIATLDSWAFDYLPLNTPIYLFVDSRADDANGSGAYTIRIQDLTIAPAIHPGVHMRFDFDGDGLASDISVFQPSNRTWLSQDYPDNLSTQFGLATDKLTPADYDGDAKTDIAIFRDGQWWRINSSTGAVQVTPFGQAGDIPVPIDYTGDGRDELAIYRDGYWWILNPANDQVTAIPFGVAGDKPVPADYDGDGKADQAVYRNGEWHLNRSTQGYTVVRWGIATDIPVPADYDGDGKTDLAVYRNGTWYLLRSSAGVVAYQWGLATDIPAPADYNQDRRADITVFRSGEWYSLFVYPNSSYWSVFQFGAAGDKPIPSAYLP